jgi:cobalt-zinc-cadmium efflux system outer membrane protein
VWLKSCYGILCVILSGTCGAVAAGEPAKMSLAQATETALSQHAAIKAAAERLVGSEGQRIQAQLRPNPTLSFQSENWRAWGNPSFGLGQDTDIFLYGSQTIETGRKRTRRIELAAHDTKIASLEKQAAEWNVRQEVKQAYLKALAAQKVLDLLTENIQYLDQVVAYHQARVEQGAMAEADLIRVQLERERNILARSAADAEAERFRIDLLRAMGVSQTSAEFTLEDVSPAPGAVFDLQPLVERARSTRIALRLGQAFVERAQANVELEKSHAKPDWSISLGYKRTAGFNTLLAGVTVPLPFFNRNEGNIFFSQSEVKHAELLLEASVTRATSEINAALAGIRRRRDLLSRMEKGILQQSEESLRISLGAYREGGADLLRLLDAQRVRNEVQLLFARTQMEYIIGIADLENAVGSEEFLVPKESQSVKP